jgi:hypothetical protein
MENPEFRDGEEAPDTEKVDLDGYGKRVPECATLFPPKLIVTRVHLVSKRDLLLIVRRKEPDLCTQKKVGKRKQRNSREGIPW